MDVFDKVLNVLESINAFLGVEIQLMLVVFVVVSLLAGFLKIRSRFPQMKKFVLGVMVFLVGIGVYLISHDIESFKDAFKGGLILGAVSALCYQIFKPVVLVGMNKLLKKIGSEKTSDDLDLFL